ncbi:MAG: long-chain-fatty-acid--CoA ligase [Pseudonocardiales bacterium]|nr:MAG: long-chain-fatty-acid--CoA ligase [Pseudonocardiales bacterium]
MSFNLATILRESAQADPDKAVLRFAGSSVTYAELDSESGRFAAGLSGAGLGPGDVVAVQLPNFPEFLVAYFGTLKAGMTMLPLNPLLRAPEIAYHLADSHARLLVTSPMFLDQAAKAAGDVPLVVVPMPGGEVPDGFRPFAALLADPSPDWVTGDIVATNADDTAVIIYTSGTTGKPKGAELTHFQLYMNCTVAGELFGARADDTVLAVLPFFHVFGLSSVLNVSVRFGSTLSAVARFEAKPVLDVIETDGVTVVLGVPTMLQALMAEGTDGRDLARLRIAISGGASLPGDVLRAFEAKFGIVVLEGYGLSETASTSSFNSSAEARKVLSIGQPIWGVEMRVVDDQDRRLPVGADNIGEIVIRGHNVMKGYLGRPDDTAAAFRNGWFHTGDLGYVDDDGFFFIVDRSKDLVIRGGYNVYPREIEEVLYAHPAIAEAAVIGKPHESLGEEVVAVVALVPGESLTSEDVIAYCKERLAMYKYPREVRFVDSLPKGPTGKILKAELRAVS